MPGAGEFARTAYVSTSRLARRAAERTGLLGRLERRYRENPKSFEGHLRSLFAIHDVRDLVTLDQPWWTYGAIDAVEQHLASYDGKARVFEYGSGASSVWLGRRAAEVHSVEHHPGFAAVMRDLLAETGLSEVVELIEVPPSLNDAPVVGSRRRGEAGRDYADYVASIDAVPGEFDLIVVDGRARVACMQAGTRRLAPGGIILFDDTQRPRYGDGLATSGAQVRRIRGWVPSLPYPRETSILRIAQP